MDTFTGRYRLIERLGAGGMSVVWRGYDEVLGRQVAVKLLAASVAADAGFRARIRREAQAAARLSHPHITGVYDYGEAADGTPFVVMELIEGPSLAQRLANGPLAWPVALRIGAEIAEALAAAHDRGLVHRDVTPANVMLAETGVKVVDFGISALAGERDGAVVGTPAYLAPEQYRGAPAQPATDVYALGLVLYQMLAGRLPWNSDGADRYQSLRPLPAVRGMPPQVAALVEECLRIDPTRRPASEAVGRRLHGILARYPDAVAASMPATVRPSGPPRGAVPTGPPPRPPASGTRIMPGPPPIPVPPPPPPYLPRRRRWPKVLGIAMVIAGLLLCGAWYFGRHASDPSAAAGQTGATRSPTPPPSPSPTAAVCAVKYVVTSDWKIGFTGQITITNKGGQDISGWKLAFAFDGNQHVLVGWSGVWNQSDKNVTVRDLIYNASLAPGKSVSAGFTATYHGDNNDKPQNFSLNGVTCRQDN